MPKLFKFTQGFNELFAVFEDEQEAYDRRAELDPTYHYTPVTIEEIKVEGYEIVATLPFADTPEPEQPAEDEAGEGEAAPKNKGGRPKKNVI